MFETKDFYKDIFDDVENRFDMSAYSKNLNRPLPIGKNKKKLGIMKDELCGRIMTELVGLRAETYPYLDYDEKEEKKAKGTRKCVIKRRIKFNYYKMSFFNDNPVLRSQEVFKSKFHDVYTLQLNKLH